MRRRAIGLSLVSVLATTALLAGPASAGTNSVTLDNGAELSVTVDAPVTGETFLIQPPESDIDVPIAGSASIGEGEPNVHWTYVVDVSASTVGQPCGPGTILDCEKVAVANLNSQVVADGSAVDVGLAVYGSTGASADMAAAAGDQPLNTPSSPDVNTVINSIVVGGVNQFTARSVGIDATNFTAGLDAALTSVAASTAASKNVVFLSDGLSNQGGAGFPTAVANLAAAGATIYSFAVGAGSSCTGGGAGTLEAMAASTGGTCSSVPNPADLPDIVEDVTATELNGLSLTVDGAPVAFDSISNPPPFDGPDSSDIAATAADQGPGAHVVCLSATGTGPKDDPASEATVEQCETYYVYGFELAPTNATNELSMDQDHELTATLLGEPGFLDGFEVDFEVTSGPNAGASFTGNTDSDGEVEFSYTNPNVDASGLGTDTIEATVTVNGDTATLTATKDWVDTIPPEASCMESVNPSGRAIPRAPGNGGQGQNQDGFYVLGAADNIWSADQLQVFVTDSGSGTVFGPYEVGTTIKYTEAARAPQVKAIGGPSSAVDHHLIGNGDAVVTAIDGSGNVSPGVSCLVPPPPK